MQGKHLAYRPDIDGLRALAVLAVIIFHFNKEWLPGGFVGVDIFFVISGYLITGIISHQAERGEFSFAEFYLRRIRRIVPATLFVTLASVIFGACFMLPEDSRSLSKSAIAATFSAANIYFWKFLDTGYFAASSDTVPLLHLWSLGVEEQFYLLWPALLILALKAGGRYAVIIGTILLAAASFWLGQSTLTKDPSFAYYMLPSRAGELLIGAVTYWICGNTTRALRGWISESLSIVGALGLAGSFVFINEADGFPGFISLVPAAATALVIIAGAFGGSGISSVLSIRPAVAIGLVSFSLYLWHWPVLAFYRYAYGEPSLLSAALTCAAVIVAGTAVSYFYIENRFRSESTPRKTLLVATSASAAIVAVAAGLVLTGGDPVGRLTNNDTSNLTQVNTKPAIDYKFVCQLAKFDKDTITDPRCVVGDLSKAPSMLIIGDSNASHYLGFIRAVAEDKKVSVRNITQSACIPFFENNKNYLPKARADACAEYNANVMTYVKDYKTIFISAQWATYNKSPSFYVDFEKQIATLSSTVPHVIIGLQAPRFKKYDRACAEKSKKIAGLHCEENARFRSTSDMATNLKIIEIASKFPNVKTFTIRSYLCNDGTCSAYLGGKPLYYNTGHLSIFGSYKLGQKYLEQPDKRAELLF